MIWRCRSHLIASRFPVPAGSSSLSVVRDVVGGLPAPAGPLSLGESLRLVAALGSVPDPRKRRGVRHSLQSVLLLVVGGLMAGKTHLEIGRAHV